MEQMCQVDIEKARLAQSVERLALNQVVVGSSPTVGVSFPFWSFAQLNLIINRTITLICAKSPPVLESVFRIIHSIKHCFILSY